VSKSFWNVEPGGVAVTAYDSDDRGLYTIGSTQDTLTIYHDSESFGLVNVYLYPECSEYYQFTITVSVCYKG